MAAFREVKNIPHAKKHNDLQRILKEIEDSGIRYVELNKCGYKTHLTQANCYKVAIKRAGLNWGVYTVDGVVYLDTNYLCR